MPQPRAVTAGEGRGRTQPGGVRSQPPGVGTIAAERTFSRALMGARYRLEVAVAIARGKGPFWSTQLANELGLPLHYVTKEVHALAAAGLIEPLPTPGDRRRFYRRVESTLWSSLIMLAEELGDPASAVTRHLSSE